MSDLIQLVDAKGGMVMLNSDGGLDVSVAVSRTRKTDFPKRFSLTPISARALAMALETWARGEEEAAAEARRR